MASKKLRPVHPGDILKNDFLKPLEITSYRLAKELGVSRPTITQLVARRRNVTAEMALCLARYFGTSAQVWQNLQAQYDLEVATSKIGKVVKQKIRPRSDRGGRSYFHSNVMARKQTSGQLDADPVFNIRCSLYMGKRNDLLPMGAFG